MSVPPKVILAAMESRQGHFRLPKKPEKHISTFVPFRNEHRETFVHPTYGVCQRPTRMTQGMSMPWGFEKTYAVQGLTANKPEGNLGWDDYRFWFGVPMLPALSRLGICRACKRPFHGVIDRKKHMEDSKHTLWLIKAYGLLQKDSKCVVCDQRTTHEQWGIPLCCDVCRKVWMFNGNFGFGGLEYALRLAEKV